MNNHQLLDGICLCYEFGLADDVRAVRSGDGVWFVRLCQLLTGQPMLAAVLVLLSSTPCSPGTARGVKPMQMWVPLGCSVRSRRPPERPGPAWYSTAPGGGGRRRRHGLCVYGRGSVARRHWPAPKPQLVAPAPCSTGGAASGPHPPHLDHPPLGPMPRPRALTQRRHDL